MEGIKRRRLGSEAWQELLRRHASSGEPVSTFCQREGVTTHSQKKLDETDLIEYRNRFDLPLTDEQAKGLAFHKPAEDSPEMRYLKARREALGGPLPRRETTSDAVPVPALDAYGAFALAAGGKQMRGLLVFSAISDGTKS